MHVITLRIPSIPVRSKGGGAFSPSRGGRGGRGGRQRRGGSSPVAESLYAISSLLASFMTIDKSERKEGEVMSNGEMMERAEM